MGKLVYAAITSLDGYIADRHGRFDWGEPDEQVHSFVNDLQRSIGTSLYGRRLYEVMSAWEDMDLAGEPPAMQDYAAIWRRAEKIVYSKTLASVSTAKTRLEREFDVGEVRAMKAAARDDLSVGGATLAAHAFHAGLVDECHLFLSPVVVGGGTRALPDGVRAKLELVDERRFDNGTVYVRYRVEPARSASEESP